MKIAGMKLGKVELYVALVIIAYLVIMNSFHLKGG